MKINSLKAAAHAAYPLSDTAALATMPESLKFYESFLGDCNGFRPNRFQDRVHTSLAHSVRGAAATWYAALTAGSACTTNTLLKDAAPMMGDITDAVRAQLPGVIHMGADDSQQSAETLVQLNNLPLVITASDDPQTSYDMSMLTHLAAMEGEMTAVHLYPAGDEEMEVNVINDEDLDQLWNFENHVAFHDSAIALNAEEVYPSGDVMDILWYMADRIEDVTGHYVPFVTLEGDNDAENIIFAPGYIPAEERSRLLNAVSEAGPAAVITLNILSPFPAEEIDELIPKTAKNYFVFEASPEGQLTQTLADAMEEEVNWLEWISGAEYEFYIDEDGSVEHFAIMQEEPDKAITPAQVMLAFNEIMGERLVLSDEGLEGEAAMERLYGCNLGIRHARAVINNFSNKMKAELPEEDQKVIDDYLSVRMSNDIDECMPKIEALREMTRKHEAEEGLAGECCREIISMEDRMPKRCMWATVRLKTALNSGLGTLLQTIPEPEDFRYLIMVDAGQEAEAGRLETLAKAAGKVSIFYTGNTDSYEVLEEKIQDADLVSGPAIVFYYTVKGCCCCQG